MPPTKRVEQCGEAKVPDKAGHFVGLHVESPRGLQMQPREAREHEELRVRRRHRGHSDAMAELGAHPFLRDTPWGTGGRRAPLAHTPREGPLQAGGHRWHGACRRPPADSEEKFQVGRASPVAIVAYHPELIQYYPPLQLSSQVVVPGAPPGHTVGDVWYCGEERHVVLQKNTDPKERISWCDRTGLALRSLPIYLFLC